MVCLSLRQSERVSKRVFVLNTAILSALLLLKSPSVFVEKGGIDLGGFWKSCVGEKGRMDGVH